MNVPPASRSRSLWPREHGAYAELLFPLITAVFLRRPTLAGGLLAVGIVAGFLLHEPLLVLLGRRGTQAHQKLESRARHRVRLLAGIGALCTVAGLWNSTEETRWAFASLLPVVVMLGWLLVTKRDKTLFGESLVAMVLSCSAIPVALACGVALRSALVAGLIWSLVFLLGTSTVHAIFARSRSGTLRPAIVVGGVSMLLIVAGVAAVAGGGPWWMLAPLPAAVVSAGMLGFGLSPKRLRVLGWALVLANLVTLAMLTHTAGAEERVPGPFEKIYRAGEATFEVEQIYGGDIEDDDSFLYLPVDIAVDAEGNLYVLDAKSKCVKKFDFEGNHVTTFSRPGEGPGDLDRPQSIDGMPDGTLLVYDGSLRRFSYFTNDGAFVDSREFHEMGTTFVWNIGVDTRGHILAAMNKQDFRNPEAPIPFWLSRLELDPFRETRIDSAAVALSMVVQHGESQIHTGKPGAAGFFWALAPNDHLVVGNSGTGVLRTYDENLQLLSEFSVQTAPAPFTQEDRVEFLEQFTGSPVAEVIRDALEFPERHPWFHRLYIDDEGFILLQVRVAQEGRAEYEVRHPDGTYLTNIVLPALSRAAILVEGRIYKGQLHEESDYAIYRYHAVEP